MGWVLAVLWLAVVYARLVQKARPLSERQPVLDRVPYELL